MRHAQESLRDGPRRCTADAAVSGIGGAGASTPMTGRVLLIFLPILALAGSAALLVVMASVEPRYRLELLIAAAAAAMAAWLFAMILLYRQVGQRQTASRAVPRAQADAALGQSQEELQDVGAAADAARDQDKIRIARELHDEFRVLLTLLQMDVAWCKENLPAADHGVARRLDRMAKLLAGTVAMTSRTAADVRPLVLDHVGLLPAVESLAENFRQRTGIPCELVVNNPGMPLPGAHSTAVLHVVHEALTNVAKHAGAKRVEVAIEQRPNEVIVNIRDDGRGFAAAEAARGRFVRPDRRARARLSCRGRRHDHERARHGNQHRIAAAHPPRSGLAVIRVFIADASDAPAGARVPGRAAPTPGFRRSPRPLSGAPDR